MEQQQIRYTEMSILTHAEALEGVKAVAVLEKDVSLGSGGMGPPARILVSRIAGRGKARRRGWSCGGALRSNSAAGSAGRPGVDLASHG